MQNKELEGIFIEFPFIFSLIIMFFVGMAVRDDIIPHETAQNISLIFSFLTTITVLTYVLKFRN